MTSLFVYIPVSQRRRLALDFIAASMKPSVAVRPDWDPLEAYGSTKEDDFQSSFSEQLGLPRSHLEDVKLASENNFCRRFNKEAVRDHKAIFFKDRRSTAKDMQSSQSKIEAMLKNIGLVFTNIFEALLVLTEKGAEVEPAELQRLSKRSKEFEVRLNRMVFELQQKVTTSPLIMYCVKNVLKNCI
jgi:hypothetical protein